MSVVDAVKERVERLRQRRPVVDHLVRAVDHYTDVRGDALAAAVTYFAFLSVFPVLALSFAIFGQVTKVYEKADGTIVKAANQVLPGLVGGKNGISVETLQSAAPGIFSIGIVLTLYSGLRWLSGMRDALMAVFEEPQKERPGFVSGKLRDVGALLTLGTVLVLSVGLSGVATKVLNPILDLLGLEDASPFALGVVAVALGYVANVVLFFAFFRLLAQPNVPSGSLWSGAVLGATAYELLKQLSTYLLSLTKNSDAFQSFGIALILLVWINYFSRVVVFSAAWAQTTVEARALHDSRVAVDQAAQGPQAALGAGALAAARSSGDPRAAFAAGAAAMLGLVAVVRRTSATRRKS